ncbi:hypothetical protein H632_c159p2 [Helicosporidium sp. ATCC 50920]|nr:hypothetical protein H632_c159p2 [Helicosporidium sp. ATCC 50920]|eukprot:KDD76619.1 hypothetical protein H632_c159p2 [Helicosporidium sp. ATCC 50920]
MAKEKKKRVKPVLEAVDETGQTKFARALGSVDSYTRERGLKALAKWLSAHEDVGKDDLIKIWKGIFYCFWHSDLQPVQLAVRYHDAFVETMRREWFGIDRLRLDKFMMLVRRIMHTMFVLLASRGWPKAEVLHCCEQWMALLLPNTSGLGVGLSYHVTDIFLTELEGAAAEAADASDLDRSQAREMGVEEGQEAEVPAKKAKKPKDGQPSSETLVLLLSPFIRALSVSSNPVLVQRLHVDVFQPLVSYARSPKSAPVVYANLDARLLAASLFERGE